MLTPCEKQASATETSPSLTVQDSCLTTHVACSVILAMNAPRDDCVITATEAADAAGITYRQLDHWARQGWVTPSIQPGSGRGGRRRYSAADVLRLAALRHFAKSGWQVSDLGERVSTVDLERANWLVAGTESAVEACFDDDRLHEAITREGRFSVYHLEPLRTNLLNVQPPSGLAEASPMRIKRRTA